MADAGIRPAVRGDRTRLIEFLVANMPDHPPAARFARLLDNPWAGDAPNIGYLIETGAGIGGYFAGIYAERPVAGRMERFCNLSVWCVAPDQRNLSVPLARAILSQKNLTFTALTPTREAQAFWQKMRLPLLDRGRWVLAPLRAPGGVWPPGTIIDQDRVLSRIPADQQRLVVDHAPYGCKAILLDPGGANVLVMAQRRGWGRAGLADILFASDWQLAVRFSMTLAFACLRLFRTPFLAFDARRLASPPRRAWFLPRDTFFLSAGPDATAVDSLYSETVLNAAPGPGRA